MKITRFEDIEAWQEARRLVRLIQGAAVSSMANIAEGFSRKSNREFIQYLFISKSSAAEVQSHIYVAADLGYLSKEMFNNIYSQAEKVARMCSGFIKYLNSQRKQPKQPNKPNKPK